MKRLAYLLLPLLAALGLAGRLQGFVYIDGVPPWPDGNVTLELQLGSSPIYTDATTPNQTAIQAIAMWNPYMKRVQLTYVNNSGASKSKTNNKNNVFFSNDVFGTAFGSGVLAVTIGRATATAPVEMEVVVNNNRTWDSYRGFLQYSKIDLRRVLAHEFGHVLGLDHPNEAGQWVNALMNSTVSDIDSTVQDDQDGVGARYGRGTANPAVAPTITYQPGPVSIVEGQDAWFSAYANGSEPLTYQWMKDDVDIPGANTTNLALTRVTLGQAGTYKMKATNEAGTATTDGATLTVTAALAPTFTQHPPETLAVEAGGDLALNAWATSNTWITYKWTRDGVDIPDATDAWYRVYGVTSAVAGVYRAVATTAGGTATSNPCTVTVIPAKPPVFSSHPQSQAIILGNWASFSSYVTSSIPVTYQWTLNDVPIPNATSTYFSINNVKASDAGLYRLVATNAAGSTTSEPATLTVNPLPPPAVVQLPNITVQAGSSFSFSVWSSDNPTYQWYFNGSPIPGATYSYYNDNNAQSSDAGDYYVVATNASGSVTSTVGVVTVLAPNTAPLGGWRQAVNDAGMVCFLFENPARIERFDLASEAWLTPIALSRTPTTMALIGPGEVAVSFYRTLARVDLVTGTETNLTTIDSDPMEIAEHNGRLYVVANDTNGYGYRRIGHFSLAAPATPLWGGVNYQLGPGLAIDHTHGKVFAINNNSTSQIIAGTIQADGSVGAFESSEYRGYSNTATRTWLSDDDAMLFDNQGAVFRTTDLGYAGSMGGPLDSLAVRTGNGPLILRGRIVTGYSTALQEQGRLTLTSDAQHLAVHGDAIFAFGQPTGAGTTIRWQKRTASELAPPAPLPEVAASTTNYSADDVLMDRDGTLLILSRVHGNVFRWSSTEQRYLTPIPLVGRPNHAVYQSSTHRLYLGYADGYVRVVDLATGRQETVFAMSGSRVLGLGTADAHVTIAEYSGYGTGIGIYDASGLRTATRSVSYEMRTQAWNAQRRRIYQLNYSSVFYMEVTTSGQVGTTRETYVSDGTLQPPLRISPSGEVVLMGNGRFYNADTLAQNNALPHGFLDATWLGNRVYTMRDVLGGVEIKRWGASNYGLDATRQLRGRAIRIFPCGTDRLVAVTEHAQHVAFTLLDADLVVRTHFENAPDLTAASLANLSTRAEVGSGDSIIIAGFVVTGSQTKRILVRGIGPTLTRFGVSGALADPMLKIVRPDGSTVATNDDWFTPDGLELKAAFSEAKAFSLLDTSLDAAVMVELAPGAYTAQVSGKNNSTGVALVEAYDLDDVAGERRLINISTRALVGIGDKVLIPGIVVEGTTPKRLLIRAVGPSLQRFGVAGALADPELRVVDGASQIVARNDNWEQDNPDVTIAGSTAAGAFSLQAGGKDAALVVTLRPGLYTVVVSGVGDTTGVALVEVYEVP